MSGSFRWSWFRWELLARLALRRRGRSPVRPSGAWIAPPGAPEVGRRRRRWGEPAGHGARRAAAAAAAAAAKAGAERHRAELTYNFSLQPEQIENQNP